ncbi:hypothetical protein QN277_007689 [Acacia crassicarpa]|uniref:J domain-containing protein n=1 Tax=Acacia crassicarpa TaxID=499986 RepID=A0AAE1M925_9FABA|nr:hypothetical protein QN277_007689 [Acacia crassicarpa]
MACNGLSTISASDSRFFNLSTPPISSLKSLKFSSIRVPSSRSASFKPRALSVAEPYFSSPLSSEPSKLSFYELLGIPESGSLLDIKQAYKQLARKYHPDVSPPDRADESTKIFILVREAYETLSDPQRRAMYDRAIHLGYSTGGYDDEMAEIKKGWRACWEVQLAGLNYRRTYKYGDRSQSWASRVRRTHNEAGFSK